MPITVSALHVYPIKSCRGLDLKAVRFDRIGPVYDRRFMLVDEQGKCLTQRDLPRMALIEPRLGPTSLQVSAPRMPALKIAMSERDPKLVEVQVWKHTGPAEDVGGNAAAWFSEFLERPCRLVRLAENAPRLIDPRYAPEPAQVAFSDAFPVLLLSEASLEDLNGRLQQKLPMNRFRPNLVVRGCEAFAEDGWKRIHVGDVTLDMLKPCDRCSMTTVDQITAIPGKEPLAMLATYRKRDNGVFFGQNCLHHGPGGLRVGDEVEVLETV